MMSRPWTARLTRQWPYGPALRRLLAGLTIALTVEVARADDSLDKPAPAPSLEDVEFFERHVRPVLVQRCQACHGPKKQELGLRLDSRAPTIPFKDYASTETRFAMLAKVDPDGAEELLRRAQADIDDRWNLYEQMVNIHRTAEYAEVEE